MKCNYEVLRLSGLQSVDALLVEWKKESNGAQGMPLGQIVSTDNACILLIVEMKKDVYVSMSQEATNLLMKHRIAVVSLINLFELHHPSCAIGGYHKKRICSFTLDDKGLTSSSNS